MNRRHTRAVVLGLEPAGESDLRLKLITPDLGRVRATAPGALRSRRRFSGVLDLARVIEAGLTSSAKTGRLTLEHAALLEDFTVFRENPARLARACLMLEVAELTVPENLPAPRAYNLLVRGLRRLATEPDNDRWALAYAFRLLAESGHKPELTSCVNCLRTSPRDPSFSAAEGGIVCPECGGGPAEFPVGRSALRTVEAMMAATEQNIGRIRFTRDAIADARRMLAAFIAHHLGRPSRCLPVLEQLAPVNEKGAPAE